MKKEMAEGLTQNEASHTNEKLIYQVVKMLALSVENLMKSLTIWAEHENHFENINQI